ILFRLRSEKINDAEWSLPVQPAPLRHAWKMATVAASVVLAVTTGILITKTSWQYPSSATVATAGSGLYRQAGVAAQFVRPGAKITWGEVIRAGKAGEAGNDKNATFT